MNQDVLTIPASGTINIIREHSIHAYPHARPYRDTPYVAFREKGGYMNELYNVYGRVVLHPTNDNLEEKLSHLDQNSKTRILAYIKARKAGFGFEKPDKYYMFWLLEREEILQHKPRLIQNIPSHQYFDYHYLKNYTEIRSTKGTHSKSGVFEFHDFRDNLIIDKYHPTLQAMRSLKPKHLSSENSEDAITWNVFKSLRQIHPEHWFPQLISNGIKRIPEDRSTEQNYHLVPEKLEIKLWQSIKPPAALHKTEGATEVDIVIETDAFVWVIEAKYKSDISTGTTHNKERNQILRNIDVGSNYAGKKDFYFSLLVLDERHTPKGVRTVNQYYEEIFQDREQFVEHFQYRKGGLQNFKGLGVLYWKDITEIFNDFAGYVSDEFESYVAVRANDWLVGKGIN